MTNIQTNETTKTCNNDETKQHLQKHKQVLHQKRENLQTSIDLDNHTQNVQYLPRFPHRVQHEHRHTEWNPRITN